MIFSLDTSYLTYTIVTSMLPMTLIISYQISYLIGLNIPYY